MLHSPSLTKRFLSALAVTGLLAVGAAAPSASAAPRVTCETTGARWHLAEYFHGETTNHEASGDRYRFYAPDEAFCLTMDPWIPKLTGAANDPAFEHDSSKLRGVFIPPGYDLIPKRITPPGYNCIAMVNDPRLGHHHDNAHWGSCMPVKNNRTLPTWSWFSVLPPEN